MILNIKNINNNNKIQILNVIIINNILIIYTNCNKIVSNIIFWKTRFRIFRISI